MPPLIKRWLGRAVLLLVALLMACLAVELALRIAARRPPLRVRDRSARYVYPTASRQHPWSTGVTNPLRIAIVGDSVTYGAGVQPYDTYGARLEWMLNLNSNVRPVEVHVCARPGTNPDMQAWQELPQALAVNPDLLILGLCLNDAESKKRRDEIKAWRNRMMGQPPPAWLAPLVSRSRLAAWVYGKKEDLRINRAYLEYYRFLYDPQYDGWIRLCDSLRYFHQQCRDRNIPFLVVVFPLISDLRAVPYPFDYVHERIGAFLAGEQIPCMDLRPALLGLDPRRLEVVPRVDPHPDEIAHRIMAEALFDYLLDTARLPPEYQPQLEMQKEVRLLWNAVSDRRQAGGEQAAPEPTPAAP